MREKILKLFEVSHSTETYMTFVDIMCNAFAAQLDDEELAEKAVDAIRSTVKAEMPALNEKFVELYARTYTEEEIDGMIAYHSSPVGQKVAAVGKQLAQDAAAISSVLEPKIQAAVQKVALEYDAA